MELEKRRDVEQLKEYLGEYLRQRGHNLRRPFRCLNPDHTDVHPSMSYNAGVKNVHCFACGATYDLLDLVGLDYGLSRFAEQCGKVCEIFGLEPLGPEVRVQTAESSPRTDNASAMKDRAAELDVVRMAADDGYAYFERRGIAAESCRKYGLFQKDKRVYFPVVEDGICTGWCARATDDAITPRYLNSAGPLGLWNGDLIRQDGAGRELFVTEGIVDAILLEQLEKTAVSLCGSQNIKKFLSRCEQNLKAANTWNFVVCGDPDEAGDKMNGRLLEGLSRLGLSGRKLHLEGPDGDVASLYVQDREKLLERLAGVSENAQAAGDKNTSMAAYVDDFFREAESRAKKEVVSSGFTGLDKLLDGGMHPGLYVVGAISSLGKTSFVLQVADAIAQSGTDVVFFSLEQSRDELMAKSLSRTTARLEGAPYKQAFTVRQLLGGQFGGNPHRRQLLQNARDRYGEAAASLFLREGVADIGAEEIRRAVKEHRDRRGAAPVVVVDYLQILKPADSRATDKQNTDRAVVDLKRISRDFDTPVIAVSSFNRENYRAAVSMEAFKESGAIEYSSDVLLGLQLAGAGSKEFKQNAEKVKEPRQLQLVMLKNRNGIPYAKVGLQYYAKYNLFTEMAPQRKAARK